MKFDVRFQVTYSIVRPIEAANMTLAAEKAEKLAQEGAVNFKVDENGTSVSATVRMIGTAVA